jgi:hypothetical protein
MHRAALVLGLPLVLAATAPDPLAPGLYSNEEQVYFEKEAGHHAPPWLSLRIDDKGKITTIDAFGHSVAPPGKFKASQDGADLSVTLADGRVTQLRRARPVTCWSAVRKETKTPEGKDDWLFVKDVKLHDQGGRALIGQGAADVKQVVIRMRYVTWAGSKNASNRPSLVLYVHTPDDPDHAVSYVWADPQAARLGVNLRWMQASCTIDGAEAPSEITNKTFRG